MPLPLFVFVAGAVGSIVIGAGAAYLDDRNHYDRNERINRRLEEEADSLVEAFELARDPTKKSPDDSKSASNCSVWIYK